MNRVHPGCLLSLVSVVLLCSCDSNEVEGPAAVELNISGTITAEVDGSPIHGAKVLLGRMFVAPVASETTSDGGGRYALRLRLETPDAYYEEWGNPCGTLGLEVRANGYHHEGMGRTINFRNPRFRCTNEPQIIDISLRSCPDCTWSDLGK
jgi:hypothetical protein